MKAVLVAALLLWSILAPWGMATMDNLSPAAQWFATLGVGGALAGFIFWFYRRDMKAAVENWRGQTELLVEVVRDNTAAIEGLRAELRGDSRAPVRSRLVAASDRDRYRSNE